MNLFLKALIAGLASSYIKSIAEPPLEKLGKKYFPASNRQLAIKGADVSGHPLNMPPAVLANNVAESLLGHKLADKQAKTAMQLTHYILGIGIAEVYFKYMQAIPRTPVMGGIVPGAVIWAFTHGSSVPALNLQGKVKNMPAEWWVWELGSHIIYGISLEQCRRLLA